MEPIDAVKALAALAQETRLAVFRALVEAGPKGLTPGDLAARLSIAANTLSFHLKELSHADLVSQERAGRNLIYRAEFARMNDLLTYLTQDCCQGQSCAVVPEAAKACC
jgi:DNA-binding transcriptional ArsR family regulator